MKKSLSLFICLAFLFSIKIHAQTGLNFQGVARSENGVILASQNISLKLSIVQGSANGNVEFTETRKTTTNAQGLFSVVIGDANVTSTIGDFSAIDWRLMPKYLKIEMDPAAGDNYSFIGTTQLQSAAYAKYSESVDAQNIQGIIPVTKGGTGKTSLSDLKIALQLDQVNNTSDAAKPISAATQAALDLKATITELNTKANITLANAKEDTINKSKNINTDALSDIKYPTVKAVKTYIDDAVVSGAPDATVTTKGKIALTGVLTGTADNPAIANNAITADHLAMGSVTDDKIVAVSGTKINGDINGKATNITGIVDILNGGTGANNANDARTNLGLAIGANVEFPLTVAAPLTRVSNVIGMPVASSSVNGYISATDWTNFNNKINAAEKGANSGVATLDASGKIPSVQIPAISFQSANVVTSQSEMLALSNAVEGSIAIRTDNNKNYVLSTTPAATLSNWIELATPNAVTSVNGLAGPNVSLTTNNITEGATNKYYSNTLARNAISATAPLTYDASTGSLALPKASSSQAGYLDYTDWIAFNNKMGTASATATFVPYTGATGSVNLGNYDLYLGIKMAVGKGRGGIATNTAMGYNPLFSNTTGSYNIAMGQNPLKLNTTGTYNTAIGALSLFNNTVGSNNIAIGTALQNNTIGNWNVSVGNGSVANNSTGEMNTGIGASALENNTTGSYNTAIGNRADVASGNLTNATAIGNGAIVNASNTIQLGNVSIADVKTAGKLTTGTITYPNTDGSSGQILATNGAGILSWTNITGISSQTTTTTTLTDPFDLNGTGLNGTSIDIHTAENLANGIGSLNNNLSGIANTAIGIRTLQSNTSGSANTAVGFEALNRNTIGYVNTAIGTYALKNNIDGIANTAIGSTTLLSNTNGIGNTAVGEWSSMANTTGAFNTSIGVNTLFKNISGSTNIALGGNALFENTIGDNNTAIGANAIAYNTTGNNNVSVGKNTLISLTTGSNNTAIGYGAGVATGALSNTTSIGNGAIVSANNTIQLGNNSVTDVKTSGKLTTGTVTYPNTYGTSGQVLASNGSGTLTWTTPASTDLSNITGVLSIAKGGTGTSTQNFVDLNSDQSILGNKSFSSGAISVGLSNRGAALTSITFPHADDPAFLSHYSSGNQAKMSFSAGDDLTNDYFVFGYGTPSTFVEKLKISSDGQLTAPLDAKINGLTIGIGSGNVVGNTTIGNNALLNNTTGAANTALGYEALKNNSTGNSNVSIGASTLVSNTTGIQNTVVGTSSMYNSSTGDGNASLGYYALNANTTGSYNAATGLSALSHNTTGNNNTTNGYVAGYNNITGSDNTALGAASLYAHTSGNFNTAVGSNALYYDLTGVKNTAIGYKADVSVTGLTNATAIGSEAVVGESNTIALGSPAVTKVITAGKLTTGLVTYPNTDGSNGQILTTTGAGTLTWTTPVSTDLSNITGVLSIAKGGTGTSTQNFVDLTNIQTIAGKKTFNADLSINGITVGRGAGNLNNNTAIGLQALNSNISGQYNTALGNQAMKLNTYGNANVAIGNEAFLNNTTGSNNNAIGANALMANTTGSYNTSVGNSSMYLNTTGANNAAYGYFALRSNTTGNENTATGYMALLGNTQGAYNTATGSWALQANTVGNYNTAMGYNSSTYTTSGIKNTSMGAFSLYRNTNANQNTSIGAYSLENNNTGSYNTSTGSYALNTNTIGEQNAAFGNLALFNNLSGGNNTGIGNGALSTNTTGSNNTAIGAGANVLTNNLTNATAIGANAIATYSNTVQLGDANITSVKTAGKLTTGVVTYPNTDGANGQILATNGSGQVVWTDFNLKQYTLTERNALTGIGEGTTIYNTTSKGIEFYNGSAWVPTTHYVGESYGGGIIFYLYDNGQHGLIAATNDITTDIRWYAGTNQNTMALADGIGAGQKNTSIIIASQGFGDGSTYAARMCNEYTVISGGVTYGDWYLPSKYELNLLRNAKNTVGNFGGFFYWSSTEINASTAWGQYFDLTTLQSPGDKYSFNTNHLRAIRRF